MWEYAAVDDVSMEALIHKANEMGKHGWEAVNFTTTKTGFGWGRHIVLLKRRVASAAG